MLTIDKEKCNKCSVCSAICPANIIGTEDGLPEIISEMEAMCFHCGHCEAYCPQEAISMDYPDAQPFTGVSSSLGLTPEQISYHLASRRSVRHFKRTPVDRKAIERLMDIVRYAPTGGNAQSVEWIVITSREKLDEIVDITAKWMKSNSKIPALAENDYLSHFISEWEKGKDLILRGTPHLAVAHEPADRGSINGVIAASYFEVTAPTLGIGTCWAGLFQMASASDELKKVLRLPAGHTVSGALMFGYPEYKTYKIPKRNAPKVLWM